MFCCLVFHLICLPWPVSSCFPQSTEAITREVYPPLTPRAWVHAETHKHTYTFPQTYTVKLTRDWWHTNTYLYTLHAFCLRGGGAVQCIWAWASWCGCGLICMSKSVYIILLQYPKGSGMGSNTLTQLSDQTNWVWDYVCICRKTSALMYVSDPLLGTLWAILYVFSYMNSPLHCLTSANVHMSSGIHNYLSCQKPNLSDVSGLFMEALGTGSRTLAFIWPSFSLHLPTVKMPKDMMHNTQKHLTNSTTDYIAAQLPWHNTMLHQMCECMYACRYSRLRRFTQSAKNPVWK